MHFATFAGSDMEALEPVTELVAEKEKDGGIGDWMDEGGFGVIDVGETAVVPIQVDTKSGSGDKHGH